MTVLKDSNSLFNAEQDLMIRRQALIATALGQGMCQILVGSVSN
ncbi:hypothetical protein [Pediococcus ethanolidurans]|nr:hypothetical protein [Pediococcus ethanolidurans]